MNSNHELYSGFEPDANEIMFGQRTLPDRPLTAKEVSKRKRIILKLVDQKLKFELIGLMNRHEQQTNKSNIYASPITPVTTAWTMPSNYCHLQNVCHQGYPSGPVYPQQNQQPQLENVWQLPIYPQQYAMPDNIPWSHLGYNSQPNQHQNRINKSPLHPSRQQPNPNLIHPSTKSLTTSTTYTTDKTSTTGCMSQKRSRWAPSSSVHSAISSAPSSTCTSQVDTRFQSIESNQLTIPNELMPSSSNEIKQTTISFRLIEGESSVTSATSLIDGTSTSRNSKKRKRSRVKKNMFRAEKAKLLEAAEHVQTGSDTVDINNKAGNKSIETSSDGDNSIEDNIVIDLTIDETDGTKEIEKPSQKTSTEWNSLNELATNLCRNHVNVWEPLSPSDLQLKNEILIQMSINPNAIRSNTAVAQKAKQKVGEQNFEKFINECKSILAKLIRADPETQSCFSESRDQMIADLNESNCHRDTSREALLFRIIQTEIEKIISPFLCPEEEKDLELIIQLMKNPHVLEENEMIKNRIADKAQSVSDVMKGIKGVLDEFKPIRAPKKFYLPLDRFVDVPIVVDLYDKTVKMTRAYATELTRVLFDSINCLKIDPKPSIRDAKFNDGSLIIVCINRLSFDWLEKTISYHLGVNIRPVKNIISKNELKTICLNFERPQYMHFDYLMEQLEVDNPRLFTRRWELRSPQHKKRIDSTKSIYVGVDVESLIILEEMNRTGILRDSSVSFEITYCDNEENFEKMNFVKMKKKRQPKYKAVT